MSDRIVRIATSENFSGPLPHPKHLSDYAAIVPGGAERIFAMAEKNLQHNIDIQNKALDAEIDDRKRGMRYGAGLFGLLILGAVVTALVTDSEVVPGLFLGAAVIGGITAFIKGRS